MPAPKARYYSTRDIMTILGVSYTTALQYMHMFEVRGQILRTKRLMRVPISVFEEWLNEHIVPAR